MVSLFSPRPLLALLSLLFLSLSLVPAHGQEVSFQAVCASAPWSPRAIGAFELIQKAITFIDPTTGQSRTFGSATQPVYVMHGGTQANTPIRQNDVWISIGHNHSPHTHYPLPFSPSLTSPLLREQTAE